MSTLVQIREKGQLTIPVKMREALGITENEVVSVSMIGSEAIILVPKKLHTQDMLEQSAKLAKKKGITLEEMLAEADEVRRHA